MPGCILSNEIAAANPIEELVRAAEGLDDKPFDLEDDCEAHGCDSECDEDCDCDCDCDEDCRSPTTKMMRTGEDVKSEHLDAAERRLFCAHNAVGSSRPT